MKERDTGLIPVKFVTTGKDYMSMKQLVPKLLNGERYDIGEICKDTDSRFSDQYEYEQNKRCIINSAAYVASIIMRFRSGEVKAYTMEDRIIGFIDDYNFYAIVDKTTSHTRWLRTNSENLRLSLPSSIARIISIKPSSNTYCIFDNYDLYSLADQQLA